MILEYTTAKAFVENGMKHTLSLLVTIGDLTGDRKACDRSAAFLKALFDNQQPGKDLYQVAREILAKDTDGAEKKPTRRPSSD